MTSKTILGGMLVCFGLAGCELSLPQLNAPKSAADERDSETMAVAARPAVETVKTLKLAEGDIRVKPPRGYCIEKSSIVDNAQGSFVVLGNCAGFSGRGNVGASDQNAVLTLSASRMVSTGQALSPEILQAYFQSEQGKAALARDGDSASVDVLDVLQGESAVYVHAIDRSGGRLPGLASEYWRAVTTRSDRLVSLTATPFDHAPMSDFGLRSLLEQFLSGVRSK